MSDRHPVPKQSRGGGVGGVVIALFVVAVIAMAAVAGFVLWSGGQGVIEEKAAGVDIPLPSLPDAPRIPDAPTLPPVEPPTLPTPGPQPVN